MNGCSRRVGVLVLTALVALAVTPIARANHGQRTLNVSPETSAQPLNVTQTLTATLNSAVTTASGTVNVDFENESGVNDVDGTTLETPDLTCSIPAGSTSCTVSYTGTVSGRDRWRSWIDHDGRDSTVEADRQEGVNSDNRPGDGGAECPGAGNNQNPDEPDCTDVIEVLWGSGTLDCDDQRGPDTEHETNPAGGGSVSNERYECVVVDASSNPDPGIVVNAEVENGVNDPDTTDGASYESPDYTCTTAGGAEAGRCTIIVTQNENEPGLAHVCFWVGSAEAGDESCVDEETNEAAAADGTDSGNDLADRVEKNWEQRVAYGIDIEPESASSGLGAEHSVTATVYDQFGEAFAGNTLVSFEFFRGSPSDTDGNTAASPDLTCMTGNTPSCTVTYSQSSTPGTDVLCGWTAIPAMPIITGTNNNPSCAGESVAGDPDDEPGVPDAAQPSSDFVDAVQKIWQQPTSAVVLDCTPENSASPRGSNHVIRCQARDAAGAAVANAEIDVEMAGINDIDGAFSPATPEFTCVTQGPGICEIVHGREGEGGNARDTGTTIYTAWIDKDNDNATTEADPTEGRDELNAGAVAEPDLTDVVQHAWQPSVCTINGTPGIDIIVGSGGPDIICGLGGADTISGGGGKDRIFGGTGSDLIRGQIAEDRLFGGIGDDQLRGGLARDFLSGGKGNDFLDGGPSPDVCRGGPGNDRPRSC